MSLRKRGYLSELTTSSDVPSIVKPFAVVRRRRARALAIDVLSKASERIGSRKLKPPKKKRKRDKNSLLRGLM
jgi:hypothetical protein